MITNFTNFAAACSGGDFFGLPKWYKYLPGTTTKDGLCTPQLTSLNDVWLVAAAVIELLLRVAAIIAVAIVIYGGVLYMSSQGDPDKTTQARHTIIGAIVGLTIAVVSATAVAFIATRIGGS